MGNKPKNFQEIILKLQNYWIKNGCNLIMPYDLEMGAGTFHPMTVFNSLNDKKISVAYVQPCRRPTDSRYGESPNRLSHYYQFQVLLKPNPDNSQQIYLDSLKEIGINYKEHDIRFVFDDWESPTLGAFGVGYEVWCDGMEITQFTYFQQMGGIECRVVPVEITYGLERIAMYVLNVDNVYDLPYSEGVTYGDIFLQAEKDFSIYNFELADVKDLMEQFRMLKTEVNKLIEKNNVTVAYHMVVKSSHVFNLLDSRGALSVSQRAGYILEIRELVKKCCELYMLLQGK
jgi:glycyl-tRNA synthetase alpha chain